MPEPVTALGAERPLTGTSALGPIAQKTSRQWRWLALIIAVTVLYLPVLSRLVAQWWNDSNYSHGFLIPFFVGYVLWERREQLRQVPVQPAWSGLVVLAGSVGLLFVGLLGAELFITRISLLGTILGLLVFLLGWPVVRALWFPLGALLMMIPLPAIIYNQIVFPLQLLASRVAAAGLNGFHIIPVVREGNVLVLPKMRLEVAEACSGIRSLMSMFALGLVYGYFAESRTWVRVLLCFAILPIAVLSNAARVMFAAVSAQAWGDAAVEGLPHMISGVVLFVVATLTLIGCHSVIKLAFGDGPPVSNLASSPAVSSRVPVADRQIAPSNRRLATAVLLVVIAAAGTQTLRHGEIVFLQQPLQSIPMQIDAWQGRDLPPLDREVLTIGGMDDYLNRIYSLDADHELSLYVGYYRSQATGDSIHSPKNCLPGSGWQQVSSSQVALLMPDGSERPVNLYVIEQGGEREVVLYWYQAHGRIVASEFRAKLYMIMDAIRLHRTDGALVRIAVPIVATERQTQKAAIHFAERVMPSLQRIIPQ
ncbi:MAG: exosortase C-terminal domain/associated protein EpsI [Terriglobales bacterium]